MILSTAFFKDMLGLIVSRPFSLSSLDTDHSLHWKVLKCLQVLRLSQVKHSLQDDAELEADLEAALAKDPFLSGFGRSTLQLQLQLLTANQSASGFTMCEIAAGNGGHTKQVGPI